MAPDCPHEYPVYGTPDPNAPTGMATPVVCSKCGAEAPRTAVAVIVCDTPEEKWAALCAAETGSHNRQQRRAADKLRRSNRWLKKKKN